MKYKNNILCLYIWISKSNIVHLLLTVDKCLNRMAIIKLADFSFFAMGTTNLIMNAEKLDFVPICMNYKRPWPP